jgi:uncharacterized protein YciI
MFCIFITYKKPLTEIDTHLAAHRAFLDEGYKMNYFIVSGPQNPRTGGIILSQLQDKDTLLAIIKNDPFIIHNVADYEVIEFNPIKYHPDFAKFINT